MFLISVFEYFQIFNCFNIRNKKAFKFQGPTIHSHFLTHFSLIQFIFEKLVKSRFFSALGQISRLLCQFLYSYCSQACPVGAGRKKYNQKSKNKNQNNTVEERIKVSKWAKEFHWEENTQQNKKDSRKKIKWKLSKLYRNYKKERSQVKIKEYYFHVTFERKGKAR